MRTPIKVELSIINNNMVWNLIHNFLWTKSLYILRINAYTQIRNYKYIIANLRRYYYIHYFAVILLIQI